MGVSCSHEEWEETFGYRARMWVPGVGGDDTGDDGEDDTADDGGGGCGCGTPAGRPGAWTALFALAALAGARRRSA